MAKKDIEDRTSAQLTEIELGLLLEEWEYEAERLRNMVDVPLALRNLQALWARYQEIPYELRS